MSKDYDMGVFVMDYLKSAGLDFTTILDAVDDRNLQKSYDLIKSNPDITKYEFVEQMGIDYDEEFIELDNFLSHLLLMPYQKEIAWSDENYDKTLKIMKENPNITKNEFLNYMNIKRK